MPDIFELNDWLLSEHPEVYESIKYLHAESFYDCALNIWVHKGRPDIFETAGAS